MKTALIIGGGGFIGHNLVKRLKSEGWSVAAVDLKLPEFEPSPADDFILADATEWRIDKYYDRIYQLAADMGGMGYISGDYDAAIMHNSALINLNVLALLPKKRDSTRKALTPLNRATVLTWSPRKRRLLVM